MLYFVSGVEKLPLSTKREMNSVKRKLSSSKLTAKKKRKTAMRSGGSRKNGVQETESRELGVYVNKQEITALSGEDKAKHLKEVGVEQTKKVGVQNSEEVKKEMKNNIVDKLFTGFGAAKLEAGLVLEVLKSAIGGSCVGRVTSFGDLEDKYEPDTGSFY